MDSPTLDDRAFPMRLASWRLLITLSPAIPRAVDAAALTLTRAGPLANPRPDLSTFPGNDRGRGSGVVGIRSLRGSEDSLSNPIYFLFHTTIHNHNFRRQLLAAKRKAFQMLLYIMLIDEPVFFPPRPCGG